MKNKRILSFFLTIVLLFSLLMLQAYAASDILSGMKVKAKAALLMNLDTDTVLYQQDADKKIYPASITKVMTALLVLDAVDSGKLSLDQKLTAGPSLWQGIEADTSTADIKTGEKLTVQELLNCLLIASAGEAANVLAVGVSGSIEAFVKDMNKKAADIGCVGTHFCNPSGMPDPDHYTTCNDIYKMAKAAMEYEEFRKIVAKPDCKIRKTNMSEERYYFSTNGLLSNMRYAGYVYSSCIGIKTGYTDDAGYCLLSAAKQNGETLVAVVMGCENPVDKSGNIKRLQFSESSRLLQWGFDNFEEKNILDSTFPAGEVKVTLSKEADYVTAVPEKTITAELPKDIKIEDFDISTDLYEEVAAPVKKGDELGKMTVSLGDTDYGTVKLVAANDVSQSTWLARKAALSNLFSKVWVRILLIVLVVCAIAVVIRVRMGGRRRRAYGGTKRRSGRGGGYRGGRGRGRLRRRR